jgi:hypothetical protein
MGAATCSQARISSLWDACDATQIDVFDVGPEWTIEGQISPDVQFD